MMLKKNKRAEVPETIIWAVVTLIIISVLIVSLFVTTIIAKSKGVRNFIPNLLGGDNSFGKTTDLFAQKSFDAYLLTNKNSVYEQIKTDGNLNDTSGNLAKNIFPKLFGATYKSVWVGILEKPNKIILSKYFPYRGGECALGFSQEIKLNAERYLILTLTGCSS